MLNNSSYEESYRCNLPPYIPSFLGIPNYINLIQGVVTVLCAVFTVPVNLYLFVIILKFKTLHQRSLLLIAQVIIVEIVYCLLTAPVVMISGISETWIFGEIFCNVAAMIHDGFAALRFYFTLVFSLDRFVFIFWPFFYANYGNLVAWGLSGVMWGVSFLRALVPTYAILDCYAYVPTFKTCTLSASCSYTCKVFAFSYVAITAAASTCLPFIFYILIVLKLKWVTRLNSVVSLQNTQNASRNAQLAYMQMHLAKKTLVVLLLIVAIAGTTPAAVLYILQILVYREPNSAIFIANMLIGRTFFNLMPVFDALALTLHKDIRDVTSKVFKLAKSVVC